MWHFTSAPFLSLREIKNVAVERLENWLYLILPIIDFPVGCKIKFMFSEKKLNHIRFQIQRIIECGDNTEKHWAFFQKGQVTKNVLRLTLVFI